MKFTVDMLSGTNVTSLWYLFVISSVCELRRKNKEGKAEVIDGSMIKVARSVLYILSRFNRLVRNTREHRLKRAFCSVRDLRGAKHWNEFTGFLNFLLETEPVNVFYLKGIAVLKLFHILSNDICKSAQKIIIVSTFETKIIFRNLKRALCSDTALVKEKSDGN